MTGSTTLTLRAPLSGYLVPLEEVPDPVFAQKLVGDGLGLDPVSECLMAPCDGRVITLHSAHHAITLEIASGLELLLHIGLDTVTLHGKGFTPRVKPGDLVTAGAALIDFDADFLATHARSLVSMMVVTDPDRIKSIRRASGAVVAGRDMVLELELAESAAEAAAEEAAPVTSGPISIPNASGLHARPAAILASTARQFASDVCMHRGDRTANAKSVTAVMSLDVRHGDEVVLAAKGPDAQQAIERLADLIRGGLGDADTASTSARTESMPARRADVAEVAPDDPELLRGVPASPGLALGTVLQLHRGHFDVVETAANPDWEQRTLAAAIDTARHELHDMRVKLNGQADKSAIFAAQQEVLDDPDLRGRVRSTILEGKSAAFAWQQCIDAQASELATLPNPLLAARATDVRDVGDRVMRSLTGSGPRSIDPPANSIVIADDLTPSDMANLDATRVRGACTTLGSATSHASIIARSRDLPLLAGVDIRALDIPDGTPAILDATRGTLRLNPAADEVARFNARQVERLTRKRENLDNAGRPAMTADGYRVEVVANIGGLADAQAALETGGEGVGLLRTEFLFLDRDAAPSEDEQAQVYSDIAQALGPDRPLIIRTLDVGGDKPLRYLPLPKEDNPFLGLRGIRVGLKHPEVLRTQVRAILRSAAFGKVLVMFPMVATLTEWRAARAIFEEECHTLGAPRLPLGIMVEVPSAAILCEQFAREVDFFSIGTNDLTQYTLAMDRGQPALASGVDALDPAVLHLIGQTVAGAQQHGRWVGVCGGVASDPRAVPILLGLGVTELSVSVPMIPATKAQIRALTMCDCRNLAQKALAMETATQVRALVADPRP
jgi:phosphocarrier protein FPr